MRITPFVCAMSNANGDIFKAIDSLASQTDSKQWPLAGIELGRIEELANRLADICRLSRDALWDESQKEEKRVSGV